MEYGERIVGYSVGAKEVKREDARSELLSWRLDEFAGYVEYRC